MTQQQCVWLAVICFAMVFILSQGFDTDAGTSNWDVFCVALYFVTGCIFEEMARKKQKTLDKLKSIGYNMGNKKGDNQNEKQLHELSQCGVQSGNLSTERNGRMS